MNPRIILPLLARLGALACIVLFPVLAAAQTASTATGTITGRILNPASGEYVRYARLRVEGSTLTAISEDGGTYRLDGVPAGPARLTVEYTGYRTQTVAVTVPASGSVAQDFSLASALLPKAAAAASGAPITLATFTVASEREGNAKAIMQQRQSMNITNTVASDVFGDVAEGNVGEFLKHMPGVELDLVQGEIRTVSLRGLGAEYTQVSMDGISLASADANQSAARAFSLEQVSLSSMESIEVSKTVSADSDANAPAGTINLRTKRAFDRAGRRITVQANVTAFSSAFNFDNSYGPDDRRSRKIHPGGIFEYSDVFFNKRLGVVLNQSESMLYSANANTTVTYNYAATAADPRPIVPTAVNFLHAPRTNRRSTTTLTLDFKATPRLVLSLTGIYNYAALNNPQRPLNFSAGGRTTVRGTDPLLEFTTSATNASLTSNPAAIVKHGQAITFIPKFEYRLGALLVEGKFSGSDSTNWYDPRTRQGSIRDAGGPVASGIVFSARRSSLRGADWQIVQTGGPDIANGSNFTSPTVIVNDGRFARTTIYSGELTATLRTAKVLPVVWKTGLKRKTDARDYRLDRGALRYDYIGPGAAPVGAWASYRSPFDFDTGSTVAGARITSLSGGTAWQPDLVRIGGLYREHPEYFRNNLSAANFYDAYVGNRRKYEETIDAAYAMATSKLGRATLRAGLRREETATDSEEFDPRTPAELARAGFAEVNGRATTIPGLQYQFFSKAKVHRRGDYANWFPSASFKRSLGAQLDLDLGYSTTIRRPTFNNVAGVWDVNDETLTVNAPNPRLRPERSKNFSARLAYYFEPVGILAINAFQNNVRGLFINDRLTAQEFGYAGTDLAAYEFVTTVSSPGEVTVRGMEYEYSQSLSFLPGLFKGLGVRASYTRNYAAIATTGMTPHSINAGLSYALGRVSVYANANWRDAVPTALGATPRYRRHRSNVDIGGSARLTAHTSAFFSARNLTNSPIVVMEQVGANPALAQQYQTNGTNWTFGVKSVW